MKIINKEIEIKTINNISSEYIESELKALNIDVLRWSIVEVTKDFYKINVSCLEEDGVV